jgi:molecular chaperone DnaK
MHSGRRLALSSTRSGRLSRASAGLPVLPTRHLRATPPAQIGPLLAGIGVAAVAYGTKLLLDAAKSGQAQEMMRSAAASVQQATEAARARGQQAANAAAAAAEAARSTQQHEPRSTGRRATPKSRSERAAEAAGASAARAEQSPDSYFTTDTMGIDPGQGAQAWSGACAAILDGGEPRVVENEQGFRSTPSLVSFADGGEVLVGQPAKRMLFARGATPVFQHAQLLGLRFDSVECKQLLDSGHLGSLEVCAAEDGEEGDSTAVRVHGVVHTPEELTARVLGSLKQSAEAALGNRVVYSAVVGAPVLATERTRAALLAAGKRAGLKNIDLLDTPVAVARAAELELANELSRAKTIGVYELGGQSFSFSVLSRSAVSAGWAVRGAERLPLLGSEKMNLALVDDLVKDFQAEHGIDLAADHLALQRLHEAAEAATLELCSAPSASISLPFITADVSGPKHLERSLSRAHFEALVEPTLLGSLPACEAALRDAEVTTADLEAVVVAGGAARLAAVQRSVEQFFGSDAEGRPLPSPPLVLTTSRPEEAVSLGAAAHAQALQADQYGG